ncbi:MAG: hypothetical protein M3N31_07150 [Actinomycetota bacterium]|nr:hypothetical protein [Actinomycetota bacterium]
MPKLTWALAAAVVVLLAANGIALAVDLASEDDPTAAETTTTAPPAPPEAGTTAAQPDRGPVSDACSLVSVQSVASALGLQAGNVKPEPRPQDPSVGASCDFIEQSEDMLTVFTVLVQEAGGDAAFARSTIESRSGKKIGGLGDAAVFEQSEVGSRISVAKGPRYVQLQTQRKPATEDAMVGLARQAVDKI